MDRDGHYQPKIKCKDMQAYLELKNGKYMNEKKYNKKEI
jgi:hypothetical protein